MTLYGAGHRREYREIPSLVAGYPLDAYRISFYKPRAGVNIWTNPSVELGTTGYTAVGGAIARSALRQVFGVYSLEVTPSSSATSGVYAGSVTMVSGTLYFASVFGYFRAGQPYKIYIATTGGVQVGNAYEFRGTGKRQRVWIAYNETSTSSRRVYITKNSGTNQTPFYLDGLQVEADVLTSYIDGDQDGFIPNQQAYYWTGTPHASASVRVQATRSGGEEVKLSDYGFSVLAVVGMGLGAFTNLSTPNAYVGGSVYERTVYNERNFDIAGVVQADSYGMMQTLRSDLAGVLRPNAGIVTQPLLLRIQPLDDCGLERGEVVEVPCSLEPSSLAGNWTNYNQDPVTLSFRVYLPFMGAQEGFAGAELNYEDVTDLAWLFTRAPNGVWSAIEGLNAQVFALLPINNNRVLVAGSFTNAGSVADADYLAIYDYDTGLFTALNATPLNATVRTLALLPDGDTVVFGGDFTNAGGFANADRLAYLTLSSGAYSAINATPITAGLVGSIVVLNSGDVIFAGTFTNVGSADGDYVAKLTVSTGVYSALNATPLTGTVVRELAKMQNGNIVMVGSFTGYNGGAAIINASTGAFSVLTTENLATYLSTALDVKVGLDGKIYIGGANGSGGALVSIPGPNLQYTQLMSADGEVARVLVMQDGTLMYSGDFDVINGILPASGFGGWNGSAPTLADTNIGALSTYGYALAQLPDGTLMVGTADASSSGPMAASNVLTNNGTADTYPVFTFYGPGVLSQIRNYTTGDVIYFNITLLDGEVATLTLGPGNISFISNFRGNIINTIIPGSYTATFRLTPGDNIVNAFITEGAGVPTAITAYWKVNYSSVDDAIYK